MVESHSVPGGACHTFDRQGYHFESGPSLYSGMTGKGKEANPLGHVLTVRLRSHNQVVTGDWGGNQRARTARPAAALQWPPPGTPAGRGHLMMRDPGARMWSPALPHATARRQ